MIKIVEITFYCRTQEQQSYLIAHFSKNALEIKKETMRYDVRITYAEGEEEAKEALAYARENRLGPVESYGIKYTHKDMEEVPYFLLTAGGTKIRGIVSGEDAGAKYVYTGCSHCGAEAIQISPLKLRIKRMRSFDMVRIYPEIVISQRLKEEFERNHVTGCEFWDVIDKETGEKSGEFFSLKIHETLPPSVTPEPFTKQLCPKCGREGISFHRPIQYRLSDFSGGKDFYLSKESYFWERERWHKNGYRIHNLFISQKVCGILKKFNHQNIKIFPVFFEELYKNQSTPEPLPWSDYFSSVPLKDLEEGCGAAPKKEPVSDKKMCSNRKSSARSYRFTECEKEIMDHVIHGIKLFAKYKELEEIEKVVLSIDESGEPQIFIESMKYNGSLELDNPEYDKSEADRAERKEWVYANEVIYEEFSLMYMNRRDIEIWVRMADKMSEELGCEIEVEEE